MCIRDRYEYIHRLWGWGENANTWLNPTFSQWRLAYNVPGLKIFKWYMSCQNQRNYLSDHGTYFFPQVPFMDAIFVFHIESAEYKFRFPFPVACMDSCLYSVYGSHSLSCSILFVGTSNPWRYLFKMTMKPWEGNCFIVKKNYYCLWQRKGFVTTFLEKV